MAVPPPAASSVELLGRAISSTIRQSSPTQCPTDSGLISARIPVRRGESGWGKASWFAQRTRSRGWLGPRLLPVTLRSPASRPPLQRPVPVEPTRPSLMPPLRDKRFQPLASLGKDNARRTLKGDRRFRKAEFCSESFHAPAPRSQSRLLETSCSSRRSSLAQFAAQSGQSYSPAIHRWGMASTPATLASLTPSSPASHSCPFVFIRGFPSPCIQRIIHPVATLHCIPPSPS